MTNAIGNQVVYMITKGQSGIKNDSKIFKLNFTRNLYIMHCHNDLLIFLYIEMSSKYHETGF